MILLNTMSGCCNWHKWRKRERGGENIGREVWNWINNFHQMWCFCWEQFERLIFLFMIMWYSQNVCYSTCSFQYCSLEGPLWYYILASHQLYSKNVLNRDNYIIVFVLEAFSSVLSLWGCIDIVCNNAAVLDEDNWNKTLNTNLVGFWNYWDKSLINVLLVFG